MNTTNLNDLDRVVVYSGHDGLVDPATVRAALEPVAPAMAKAIKDGVPPAGALGKACRGVRDPGHRWLLHSRADGRTRWVRCDVARTPDTLSLDGAHGVNVDRDGRLDFDHLVPHEVEQEIRRRYDELRGGVNGRMLSIVVEREMRGRREAVLGSKSGGVYLVAAEHADGLDAIADAVATFGATLSVLPCVDPKRWRPRVEAAVVDDVQSAIKLAQEAVEKARSGKFQARSGDTARVEMEQLEGRIKTWEARLAVDLASTRAQLAALREQITEEYRRAIAEREAT